MSKKVKRVTKSFLVNMNFAPGSYVIRGRNLREAVRNAMTPRGDFADHRHLDVREVMDLIRGPVFESEAWIWPIDWNEEERKRMMRH